jgi:hypothetical protein
MAAKLSPRVLLYMPYHACHRWNRILCMAAKQSPDVVLRVPNGTALISVMQESRGRRVSSLPWAQHAWG